MFCLGDKCEVSYPYKGKDGLGYHNAPAMILCPPLSTNGPRAAIVTGTVVGGSVVRVVKVMVKRLCDVIVSTPVNVGTELHSAAILPSMFWVLSFKP